MGFKFFHRGFGRQFRKSQQQVGEFGSQTEKLFDRYLYGRLHRLTAVRRFVLAWTGLLVLLMVVVFGQMLALSGYYQTTRTVPGGIYNEGVLGRFTNANPLYATLDADTTVSRLVFSGLLTYDTQGKLTGDLAKSYEVDEKGSQYTVHLRPGLSWHDGRPLTSADVVFTYKLIQNPDVQSPLRSGWQGVDITAPDAQTVVFKLPGVLAAFPYSLTTGIVPEHLLAKIPPADLRSADFNTVRPVGAGPFKWEAVQVLGNGDPRRAQQRVALNPFTNYQGGNKPGLQKFVVQVYADRAELVNDFADGQLKGIEGLTEIPKKLQNKNNIIRHNMSLRAQTMVFFRTKAGVLNDPAVRQALVRGADTAAIIKNLGYPTRSVREPFLMGQPGYDASLAQPGYDLKAAKQILDAAGWRPDRSGIRQKDGKPLSFSLTTTNTRDYRLVVKQLEADWRELGVRLNIQFLEPGDFQSALNSHGYEAILYGISVGADPDVFVYWDSSQADIRSANRLNLSEYSNPTADAALEAGRTRLDPSLRALKYRPFLEAWQKDAPALGLYQPRLLYLTNGWVAGLKDQAVNTSTDRLNNVANWRIREARVTN